jgi:hypothetical protein
MKRSEITVQPESQIPKERRTFIQALILWLQDSDKAHLMKFGRVFLLVLAGYAPFAALNDVAAPLAFGLPLLDDLGIPIGILAAIKIYFEVRKYQSPNYHPKRR